MVVIVIIVRVVMAFAAGVLSTHGQQVEEAQHSEADAGDEHHRAEDPVRWQVVGQPTADVEVQQHAAPQQEHGDTEEMNEGAGSTHGNLGLM